MKTPLLGLMVNASDFDLDAPQKLVTLLEKAAGFGYNALLDWDSDLWKRTLPSGYQQWADTIRAALARLGMAHIVQVCPHGKEMAAWCGDDCLEPGSVGEHRYICLSDPRILPAWEQIAARAEQVWAPDGYQFTYDEIRIAARDQRCKAAGKTPGQLLAAHVKAAAAMLRRVAPGKVIAAWNDMFDPFMNAKPGDYYQVKGGWGGAWEGVDKDILIFNWSDRVDLSPDSFEFWAERGNSQVYTGYYDGPENQGGDGLDAKTERRVIRGLQADAQIAPTLAGYCYASWKGDFDHLRDYLTADGWAADVQPAPAPAPQPPAPAPAPPPADDALRAALARAEAAEAEARRLRDGMTALLAG